MIEIRRAESDADLEAWRRVRIAVLPNERCDGVEELRRGATAETLYVVAFDDGELVGSGFAGRSDLGGGALAPRVLPEARRRGFGTALLRELAAHLERVGHETAGSLVDDEGSLAFAARFGFSETGRQVEQVREVRADEPRPHVPDGVELVSLAERPDLFRRTYDELALQAFEDMPTPVTVSITPEIWEREWVSWPEGSFVALAGDELVGCAGLIRDLDQPTRAENSLTAVRRDWRGRGLARALKETVISWASANGLTELYTWTQTGNENMRAVNERLGYVTRDVSDQRPVALAVARVVRRADPEKLYYTLEFFLATPTWVVTSLYLVSVLHLSPLQLVLMGTAMEASVFLCEIPTGVVADTYSRRLSLVVGYLGMGASWLLVGVIDSPVAVIALWARGASRTRSRAARTRRGSRTSSESSACRTSSSAARASRTRARSSGCWRSSGSARVSLRAAVLASGAVTIACGLACALLMPETGFRAASATTAATPSARSARRPRAACASCAASRC